MVRLLNILAKEGAETEFARLKVMDNEINMVEATEYELLLAKLKKEQKEKKSLERKLKELNYIVTSYEQNAVFQNNIYKLVKQQKDEQDIHLHLMLDNTQDIIIVMDKNLKFILGTKKPLNKVGINTDALTEKNFRGIFSSILSNSIIDKTEELLLEVLNTGGFKRIDNYEIRINEVKYFFEIYIVPFKNSEDKIIGVMYSLHNVTKLNQALEIAEKSNKAKSTFLAKMSHEIRTPMNSINGMAELILREDISRDAREHALSIKQAGANLIAIINDILDFSKIESGVLEIVPVNYQLSSVISDIINITRIRLVDKPILFMVDIDSKLPNKLIGDESRIRQILLNLLSNACKYCDEGYIDLFIEGDIIEEGLFNLKITVADSGIGIREEDISKLFKDFMQVDIVKNRNIEGTGLGLAITKSLCKAMGGSISVSSIYGKGSTFTVTLPQIYNTYDRFAIVENPDEKNILIYETRPLYSDSIERSFNNLGLKYKLVINQTQFLKELNSNTYSFVFVSSFLYESTEKAIKKTNLDIKLVLLSEYGEAVIETENVKTIAIPAHVLTIANILNNVKSMSCYNECIEGNIHFIAPSARILIVDDIDTNLKVAEGLMLPYKMQIDSCMSGRQALKMIQEIKYDIVFMDHMMPEMDGIDTVMVIRQLDGDYYKNLPIVALTANAVSGVKEMFLQNGFNDFLAKPIEMLRLGKILEDWLPVDKCEKYIEKAYYNEFPAFDIEGIDVRLGIIRTGGNTVTYLKTLEVYIKDCRERIEELNSCLASGNINLYTTYVHAIKSASASVGAKKITDMAKTLEDAGKTRNIAYINKNNKNFIKELEILIKNIKQVISTAKESSKKIGRPADGIIKNYILNLKEALLILDMEITDNIIMYLRKECNDDEINEAMSRIENSILMCEYDAALLMADELLSLL